MSTPDIVAAHLRDANKKVQLIYAFNGAGKTRLSRAFKELIAPKNDDDEADEQDLPRQKILYYNAYTEDLFYWDNDLDSDTEPKLKIQPNTFTDWVLIEQGQDRNIVSNFQRLSGSKLDPLFIQGYKMENRQRVYFNKEITFSLETGDNQISNNLKISKGEESNFIWSIFFTLLEQVTNILNVAEVEDRESDEFNQLEYVFIDDPVSSLDENHLMSLAVGLATIIKKSTSDLKFIITTHNPLFYNILHNEFGTPDRLSGYRPRDCRKYRLSKQSDGALELHDQPHDHPFSYHLMLMAELRTAIEAGQIKKYHFNFLRNILEKLATFLGYTNWGDLLPRTEDGTTDPYASRILNLSSHSAHAGEETAELEDDDKRVLGFLFRHIVETYKFHAPEQPANG